MIQQSLSGVGRSSQHPALDDIKQRNPLASAINDLKLALERDGFDTKLIHSFSIQSAIPARCVLYVTNGGDAARLTALFAKHSKLLQRVNNLGMTLHVQKAHHKHSCVFTPIDD